MNWAWTKRYRESAEFYDPGKKFMKINNKKSLFSESLFEKGFMYLTDFLNDIGEFEFERYCNVCAYYILYIYICVLV